MYDSFSFHFVCIHTQRHKHKYMQNSVLTKLAVTDPTAVPDPLLADCFDKVLDVWLCVVLIIILDQLRVDGWHSHEDINQGSL